MQACLSFGACRSLSAALPSQTPRGRPADGAWFSGLWSLSGLLAVPSSGKRAGESSCVVSAVAGCDRFALSARMASAASDAAGGAQPPLHPSPAPTAPDTQAGSSQSAGALLAIIITSPPSLFTVCLWVSGAATSASPATTPAPAAPCDATTSTSPASARPTRKRRRRAQPKFAFVERRSSRKRSRAVNFFDMVAERAALNQALELSRNVEKVGLVNSRAARLCAHD